MSKRLLIGILISTAIIIVAALALQQKKPAGNETNTSSEVSGLRIGNNAIYVAEQPPGSALNISMVAMEKAGFVVVHEADANGSAGTVIGASGYLQAGDHEDVKISLSRPAKVGEQLIAMIHRDNGNSVYDSAALDAAVIENGAPVWMIFSVEAGANGDVEIQL